MDVRKAEEFEDEEGYILLTDSQDIEATAESIGQDLTDYALLFVKIGEGKYLEVWGSESSVPYVWSRFWQIL